MTNLDELKALIHSTKDTAHLLCFWNTECEMCSTREYCERDMNGWYVFLEYHHGMEKLAEAVKADVNAVANLLCEWRGDCERCPVFHLCSKGRNGFKVLLGKDAKFIENYLEKQEG